MVVKDRNPTIRLLCALFVAFVLFIVLFVSSPRSSYRTKVAAPVCAFFCAVFFTRLFFCSSKRLEEIEIDEAEKTTQITFYRNFFTQTETLTYKGSEVSLEERFARAPFWSRAVQSVDLYLRTPAGDFLVCGTHRVDRCDAANIFIRAAAIKGILGCEWKKIDQDSVLQGR